MSKVGSVAFVVVGELDRHVRAARAAETRGAAASASAAAGAASTAWLIVDAKIDSLGAQPRVTLRLGINRSNRSKVLYY